ncbi:MAG: transcriptional regulator, family [Clostridia bacterium]|jgi:transcriptional regulator with XRE-family HTH domain|nr:transcriptional regulator, family [Clostridia bacterium]
MDINFSENLKKLRKEAGLTQKQLSVMLKVALSTVAMWETGSRQPDYATLKRIADFFEVSFNDLLDGSIERDKNIKSEKSTNILKGIFDDDDVADFREILRTRPEMKMLFSVSKTATKADIERTVAIIAALKNQNNNE